MNLKYFIVFVAGMAALAGCQEASEYIPSIYITEAQRQEVKTITISQAGEKPNLQFRRHRLSTVIRMCRLKHVRNWLRIIMTDTDGLPLHSKTLRLRKRSGDCCR